MRQELTITVEFTTHHTPGTDSHLETILEGYFRPKGVRYQDKRIIV